MASRHLVLDNGAASIKAGFAGSDEPLVVQNTLSRARNGAIYIGNDHLSHANLFSGISFRKPYDQGHLTSWETEKPVWDYTLDRLSPQELDPSDTHLTLTESPFQLPQLSMNTDLIVFEEYGFGEYYRCIAPSLVPWAAPGAQESGPSDFSLVVDCGYSASHVVPVLYQRPHWRAVRKSPIGGCHLNGLVRELISFRHYDVSDEPILINTIKESTLYVARNFDAELKRKLAAKCEFVLPDFKTTVTGHVRSGSAPLPDGAQTIELFDERFSVPESLFHPEIVVDSGTGSKHSVVQNAHFKSITDLVVDSIMACPEVVRPLLSANINIVGGTAKIPGFEERLVSELKKELPSNWAVEAKAQAYDLDKVAWHGGSELVQNDIIKEVTITKQDFFEHGSNWCQKQFGFRNF